jgi:hypothetical protein
MTYHAPVEEIAFTARLVGADALAGTERFAEATPETMHAILGEAARLSEEVMAPLNAPGDRAGAALENGRVRMPEGFAEAYRAIAEGGWVGIAADPAHGGMGLPQAFATMVNEMMSGACLSLGIAPLLSRGQIVALEAHAPEALKEAYLPKIVSGAWTATMNLSEPQAGSDVGAVRTRAEPRGDGSYRIHGQKIWISYGDHDLTDNVVHLVLARLPDAPRGTKGISLFLVPKRLPDAAGRAGVGNAVRPISIEEKLGLHASPTCVMEYDGATGWLVGEENRGLACMFTMMNDARLGVGVQGLGVAEAALQKAESFAAERVQGATPTGEPGIRGHADVRRMLATMRALTAAARAICQSCAVSIDMSAAAADAATREAHAARAALLTPVAKAFGTETGCRVADLGIQVHGGMGYVEETGAAQLLRDVRVTPIYEGTNGIQAMDLAGRKLSDGGAAMRALLGEVDATVRAARRAGEPRLAGLLAAARARAGEATDWMLEAPGLNDRFAGATPFLHMTALLLGGHFLLRAGLTEPARMPLARFFLGQLLPQAHAEAEAACEGAAPLYAVGPGGAA